MRSPLKCRFFWCALERAHGERCSGGPFTLSPRQRSPETPPGALPLDPAFKIPLLVSTPYSRTSCMQQFMLDPCTNGIAHGSVYGSLLLCTASCLRWVGKGPVELLSRPRKDRARLGCRITDRNHFVEWVPYISVQRFRLLSRDIDVQFPHDLYREGTHMCGLGPRTVRLKPISAQVPEQSLGHL